MNKPANTVTAISAARGWDPRMTRLGAFGFWFFLIKGLLWMSAPYLVYALSALVNEVQ
jgi:hypothetical protein